MILKQSIVTFILLSCMSANQCETPSSVYKIDERTQLRTYTVSHPYSPTSQQILISLFRDHLIKLQFNPSISSSDIKSVLKERNTFLLLRYYLQYGGTYVHVGAGTATEDFLLGLYLQSKRWDSQIILIEPEPFSYFLIYKNIYLNRMQKIMKAYQIGIGSQPSPMNELNVKIFDMSATELVVGMSTKIKADYKVNVNVTSLDELLFEQKGKQINLIYLDNKLMITQSLKGMWKIMQQSPNLVILINWEYGKTAMRYINEFIELYQQLQSIHYKVYNIIFDEYSGKISKFERIPDFKKVLQIKEGRLLFLSQKQMLPPLEIFQS